MLCARSRMLLTCAGQRHGVRVVAQMDRADVWIADQTSLAGYRAYCAHDPDHRAEGLWFIAHSIEEGRLLPESVPRKRPMNGRYPGE